MKTFLVVSLACILPAVFSITPIFIMDENWVCNVKRSCLECLRLSQCSWCQAENRCFSRKLPTYEDYCRDNSTEYHNYECKLLCYITTYWKTSQLINKLFTYLTIRSYTKDIKIQTELGFTFGTCETNSK